MSTSGIGAGPIPDYADYSANDRAKEKAQKTVSQGSASGEKGAILTKDSLDVPFEAQIGIETEPAEAGRPSLPPLFRTRFVDDRLVEDSSRDYYQELRNNLSPYLKEKLIEDEAQLAFEDRDPDLIALDTSLKFEANLLAMADRLSAPGTGDEKALISAQQFMALPELVQRELSTYGLHAVHFLDGYLEKIGRNDPSYEILLNVSNQMKEALELFKYKEERRG